MREHIGLYRGKRVDNGEWVQGYLYEHEPPLQCLVPEGYVPKKSKWYILKTAFADWNMPRQVEFIEVDPDTVGECTGLTDKNGKLIFEGDKLAPFYDDIDKMVVEFHYGCFMLCLYAERGYITESGDWCNEGNYGLTECEPLESYGEDIEIIGNIHDNKELLNEN